MTASVHDAARAACADVGIVYKDVPADGCFHQTDVEDDPRGRGDGRIKLFPDGGGGIVCNWKGETRAFFADDDRRLNDAERCERERKRQEAIRQAREEESRRHAEAATKAATTWQAAQPAENHPYLTRKHIKAHGLRLYRGPLVIRGMPCDGSLIVPARDGGGAIHTLQFIHPEQRDGDNKRFPFGGAYRGCYYSIGNPKGAVAICIAEGFATGATIHEATGYPVAVAFNAGNLEAAAKALRVKFPDLALILCADDDANMAGNPGLTKATEAALSVGGLLAVPNFGADRPGSASDFNDMAALHGAEAIRQAIGNASAPARDMRQRDAGNTLAGHSDGQEWPEPLPLVAKVEPEPYPLDALPATVRAAVDEVQGFTKAPVAMVASSALAALSLAIQAHADVQRADKLTGPVSLFLLPIADSGERKSTCDVFFTSAIRDYEAQQADAAAPALKDFRAKLDAWEAKRGGIKEKIRQLAKGGKPTTEQEALLRDLEDEKPEAPRVPKMLRGDDTPENLAWVLSREWPSSGVLSSEAGIVLGAHGMGKDSIMRNLGLLNILWDGGTLSIGRRTSESFNVHGARLTVALQVQEATLRSFFDRSGGLARGTGFLARFLVAWPESTQGFRPFTDSPASWPHLAAFNRRISTILNQPAPINEDGSLTPPMLSLVPDAKAAWIEYHNAIEGELASGGELYDVRDVASKSADNAARLAALFQMFEHGMSGVVGLECFESASRIAAWHLNESRRFFGELALPAELADAAHLDTWLIAYCRRQRTHLVPIAKLQQGGPGGLRSKATIETAMRELEEAGRARWVRDGKRKMIAVNPALMIEGGAS